MHNNKSRSLIFQKTNNLSSSKDNINIYRKIFVSKINNCHSIISLRKNRNKKKNSKRKNIKVNISKNYKIEKSNPLINYLSKNRTKNKVYSMADKKSNISMQEKEFNKIVLIEPLERKHNRNKNECIPNKNIFFIYKNNNGKKLNCEKPEKYAVKRRMDLKINLSNKFLEAQEKWKKNYFATVIQKIFRGYFYRNISFKNIYKNNNLNIYIKKKPKDKNICNNNNKTLKIKKLNIINIQKRRNNCVGNINKTMYNNNSHRKLIKLYNNKTIRKDNYSKKKRIKEIIIKKCKNYPIINLNLNNCLYPTSIYDNNNYNILSDVNTALTYRNNDDSEKYWENINYVYKLKKMFNHWAEVVSKNKIIKMIYKNHKKYNYLKKEIRIDGTYHKSNSFSEEIKYTHFGKNAKINYI